MREYGVELIGCREVHWIVQSRVGTYTTLETTGPAINLAQQLNLQPTIVALDGVRGRKEACQLRNTDKVDSCDEVNKSLWNPYE
jgi:hypothetical protein